MTREVIHMAEQSGPALGRDLPGSLDELEARMKALDDAGYSASVIDKRITEARHLLQAGSATEAEQKHAEIKVLVERAEASINSEPLAWRLFWIEVVVLCDPANPSVAMIDRMVELDTVGADPSRGSFPGSGRV
jgi:hypothetical protein